MTESGRLVGPLRVATCVVAALVGIVSPAAARAVAPPSRFVTSWAPSPIAGGSDPYLTAAFPTGAPRDQSVRMVVRVTSPGAHLRLRLSNRFGPNPVRIGPVRTGLSGGGPEVVAGSSRPVLFRGLAAVTLAPGEEIESDAVAFPLEAGDRITVSLHVWGAPGGVTWHRYANAISYLSPPGSGDHTADDSGASYPTAGVSWFWLSGVDQDNGYGGTVVALGDSITDGWPVAPNQYETWPDVLADRMTVLPAAARRAVVNAGIAGNDVRGPYVCPLCGEPAVVRAEHDGLSQRGVRDLIVFEGTNDLAGGATAADVIAGLTRLAQLARSQGVRVFGATITPRSDAGWTSTMEAARETINHWVRTSAADNGGVFDFDAVLRSPTDAHALAPQYDSGDHVHPNALGLRALGESIPLRALA